MNTRITPLNLPASIADDAASTWDRLGQQLHAGAMAASVGLLAVGYALNQLAPIGRTESGDLIQLAGALLASIPVAMQLLRNLRDHSTESFTDQLVTLAILGAIVTGEYATAVLVPVIMDLAHVLEQRGIPGTQAAIDGLQRLTSRPATIVDASGERRVAPQDVRVGDVLLVRPGEVLVADGVVRDGTGAMDESSLTGESIPREVKPADRVLAGTLSVDGLLRVQVTSAGEQTSLGNIRRMLSAAVRSKAPITQTVERYAELYVPVVLLLGAAVFLFTRDMYRVITVFIVSCPCALVLSGPAAMIAALANATRHGILIKSTKFLDSLADADTVVFDKTGTVTVGQLAVTRCLPGESVDRSRLLKAAVECATASQHPVSQAVARYAAESAGLCAVGGGRVVEVSGRGIEVHQSETVLRLGRPIWLMERGVSVSALPPHDGPIVGVSENDRLLGFLLLADQLRLEAPAVMADLRLQGIERIVLLTGDRAASARPVAEQLEVECVISDALPEGKLAAVQEERSAGRNVIVVGDGVNDALALAAGHVGIAMGARGSDIAIQSADIALMTNDLGRVSVALRLARKARRMIAQNVGVALCASGVMFGLGSAGWLTPLSGAVLHNVGTLIVLLNSARVLRV